VRLSEGFIALAHSLLTARRGLPAKRPRLADGRLAGKPSRAARKESYAVLRFIHPGDSGYKGILMAQSCSRCAERLYADLQNKGVRCWFAPEDMETGDKILDRIDREIRVSHKLLLIF
jgi:hypothetical protein